MPLVAYGRNDNEATAGNQCVVANLKCARHALFIHLPGNIIIPAMSPSVVDQFAIFPRMIPLRSQGLAECRVELRTQSVQGAPKPDVEEVHQIRIRNRVIVGRISYDNVELAASSSQSASALRMRLNQSTVVRKSRRSDASKTASKHMRHPPRTSFRCAPSLKSHVIGNAYRTNVCPIASTLAIQEIWFEAKSSRRSKPQTSIAAMASVQSDAR